MTGLDRNCKISLALGLSSWSLLRLWALALWDKQLFHKIAQHDCTVAVQGNGCKPADVGVE